MKQGLKKIFVTKKDVRFFQYLHAVKVSTYERVTRDIYTSYKVRSVSNRMRKMEDNHLLVGWRNRSLSESKRIVSLTARGFDLFIRNSEEQRMELKSNSVEHDLSLVDIRHKLMKQEKIKTYLTENEIQTWGSTVYREDYSPFVDLRSDAIVNMQTSKGTVKVPVEYDAHHKSKDRYTAFVDKYYNKSDVAIVFMVYEQDQIMKAIKDIEEKKITSGRPKFFYALRSDLLKSDTATFVNCEGDRLKL